MAESVHQQSFSLVQLGLHIKRALQLNFEEAIWVRAEIAQYQVSRGHHYLDLIENSDEGETLARIQAVLWAGEAARLKLKHGAELTDIMAEGRKVLLRVQVSFHERYGLKLTIQDVDPAYTLGEMEIRRREILKQLDSQGLTKLNRAHTLPPVIQRVAIISTAKAAGYEDFVAQLNNNPYGYDFELTLFESAMQGIHVKHELVSSLTRIAETDQSFDCIVIIRGGGSRSDLASFDHFEIGQAIAQSPFAVLTGLGHERDFTIADHCAHTILKTPTAVAEFVLSINSNFEASMIELSAKISTLVKYQLTQAEKELTEMAARITATVPHFLEKANHELDYTRSMIQNSIQSNMTRLLSDLELLEERLSGLDPAQILKRGYSITRSGGSIIRSRSDLAVGDEIETIISDGILYSRINKTEENE